MLEAKESHKDKMHDRFLSIIRQHLSVRLEIPPGAKLRKVDTDAVGKYTGADQTIGALERWLTNLAITYQLEQYGGEQREQERVLHTNAYLDGEAKKWYQNHVANPR